MVPIALTTVGEFDEESFCNYLLEICKQHKEQKKALAFAFIVYDFEDNTIQQILENKKYWTALDKISGKYLSVFYINTQDSYYNTRLAEIENSKTVRIKQPVNEIRMKMMYPITDRLTPLENSINFLKKEFNIRNNFKHPFVLFFQTDGDYIIDYFAISLKQERLEDSFLELKRQIKSAVQAIDKITPENYYNHSEIFKLIETSVKAGNFSYFFKTKIATKIGLDRVIKFLELLSEQF